MDSTQERRSNAAEVSHVFREMGLETQQQRNEVLARQNPVVTGTLRVPYVLRLSNSSQPAPTVA